MNEAFESISLNAKSASQILIVRPCPTLWCHPINNLIGVFDIAGFAMHAITGIDLQALAAGILSDFINPSWAKPGAWVGVFLDAFGDANIGVANHQMDWLIFFVRG